MKTEFRTVYIKPTRFVHDSGYRMFEVGYILEMGDDKKVKRKEVLGNCSDHIFQDYMHGEHGGKYYSLNFDLTKDGYIRIWSHAGQLVWEDMPLSSAQLNFIPKNRKESKKP